MNREQALLTAKKTLEDHYLDDKHDNLDNFRHIAKFLAQDIINDIKDYDLNGGARGYFIRRGILKQITEWSIPQIAEMYRKLGFYIKGEWFDKPLN